MTYSPGKVLRDTWDKLIVDASVEMIGVVISESDWVRLRAEVDCDRSLYYHQDSWAFRDLPIERRKGDFQPQIVTRP